MTPSEQPPMPTLFFSKSSWLFTHCILDFVQQHKLVCANRSLFHKTVLLRGDMWFETFRNSSWMHHSLDLGRSSSRKNRVVDGNIVLAAPYCRQNWRRLAVTCLYYHEGRIALRWQSCRLYFLFKLIGQIQQSCSQSGDVPGGQVLRFNVFSAVCWGNWYPTSIIVAFLVPRKRYCAKSTQRFPTAERELGREDETCPRNLICQSQEPMRIFSRINR